MTSVCGHVMSLDFPAKFNNWDRVDPNELFGCPTEQKEATPKLKMPAFLSSEAKNADYLGTYLPYNIVRICTMQLQGWFQ